MSTLDMLLAADCSKVTDIPTGQVEIERLTKVLGEPFIVTVRAATWAELQRVMDLGGKKKGKKDYDAEEAKWMVYEFTKDPDLKNQGLQDKYGIKRPVDIVSQIFLGGEIITLSSAIMTLSGFDKDDLVSEIKN